MLVLGRRTDESLILGSDIIITILAIEGDRVKIGIDAPRHVTILRTELRDRQPRVGGERSPASSPEQRRAS